MFKSISKSPMAKAAGALAVAASLAFAGNAKAATVQYYTTGVFNNGMTSITEGNSKLTFTGEGSALTPDTALTDGIINNYQFGLFTTANGSPSVDGDFSPVTFTLTIHETSPIAGAQAKTATLSGTLARNDGTGVVVTFTGGVSFGAGPSAITYTPAHQTVLPSGGKTGYQEFDGTIGGGSSAPMPTSAAAGVALLAGVSGLGLLRKRRAM